jgi:hypothetical protein
LPTRSFACSLQPKAIANRSNNKVSNHQIIKSAITSVCLAGEPNKKKRVEVLEALNRTTHNVIILFRNSTGTKQDFKAIYVYNESKNRLEFIFGSKDSPEVIDQLMVNAFYRYDSGAKKFRVIPENKSLSLAVNAVSIKPLFLKKLFK